MKITKVRDVKTPVRGTDKSAGLDFFVPNDYEKGTTVFPGRALNIPSGIHVKVPEGYALIVKNKSGVALNKGLQVGACVIDEDYQGEVHLHVVNVSQNLVKIEPGEKLVQMLLIPVKYDKVEICKSIQELYQGQETKRGKGGFGSTGSK